MGFLDKLFGGKKAAEEQKEIEAAVAAVECPHAALTARWDSAADMGKNELVSHYICEACGASFNREEGAGMLAAAADRLKISEDKRREDMR